MGKIFFSTCIDYGGHNYFCAPLKSAKKNSQNNPEIFIFCLFIRLYKILWLSFYGKVIKDYKSAQSLNKLV